MRDILGFLGLSALLLVLLFAVIWWPIYKYHDCKRVGHSTLYCVMDIGH